MILLCVCRAPGSVESCIPTRDMATPLAGLTGSRARLSSTQAGDMAASRGILSWKIDLRFVLLRYSELAIVQGLSWLVSGCHYPGVDSRLVVISWTLLLQSPRWRMHTSSANSPQALYWEHKTTTPWDFEILRCFTNSKIKRLISMMEKKILCWCTSAVLCVFVFSPD